jgi:hypothetical protein
MARRRGSSGEPGSVITTATAGYRHCSSIASFCDGMKPRVGPRRAADSKFSQQVTGLLPQFRLCRRYPAGGPAYDCIMAKQGQVIYVKSYQFARVEFGAHVRQYAHDDRVAVQGQLSKDVIAVAKIRK